MKKMLITIAILTTATGITRAQVTKTDFSNNISVLRRAIKDKQLTSQNNTIKVLVGLMDNQIAYLVSINNTKGRHPEIISDRQIEAYVKGLPTDKIITEVPQLTAKLNTFAATCQ